MKTIVLCGYSGSGKDTVCKELIRMGYNKIITYTTRPMRPNEKQNESYHFISETEFFIKEMNGFFAETMSFTMADGKKVYYGSAKCDYDKDKSVIILNPYGIRQIKKLGISATIFYLKCNTKILVNRLKSRGDDIKEINRRIVADSSDFENISAYSDFEIDCDYMKPSEIAKFIKNEMKSTRYSIKFNYVVEVGEFVRTISKFNVDIDLGIGRYIVDAKSILGILSLDLSKPVTIHIHDEVNRIINEIREKGFTVIEE